MSVFENTVLVDCRPSYGQIFLKYLTFILTVFLAVETVMVSPMLFFIPTAVMAFLTHLAYSACMTEYEYTYMDGELDIAKIKAKRKRKEIEQIDLENLILVAPKGSNELNNYHRSNETKIYNATSRKPNRKTYEIVYRKNNTQSIISFEPDDNMLDLIRSKHMSKVIL